MRRLQPMIPTSVARAGCRCEAQKKAAPETMACVSLARGSTMKHGEGGEKGAEKEEEEYSMSEREREASAMLLLHGFGQSWKRRTFARYEMGICAYPEAWREGPMPLKKWKQNGTFSYTPSACIEHLLPHCEGPQTHPLLHEKEITVHIPTQRKTTPFPSFRPGFFHSGGSIGVFSIFSQVRLTVQ